MFRIERFSDVHRQQWNQLVRDSKNGTFLFDRGYMDYHRDRFNDHSLLIFDASERRCTLLPANRHGATLLSHGGLTYGGLVVDQHMTTTMMVDLFDALLAYLRGEGFKTLIYKTVPSIYHRMPAEEDRYALFLHDAQLYRRDVLSVVDRASPGLIQARRRRGIRKALAAGLVVEQSERWADYWTVLTDVLESHHGAAPVHSLKEITRLKAAFPDNIRLFICRDGDQVVAGVVLYICSHAVHAQYIAGLTRARPVGSLDLLLSTVIEHFGDRRYFDFGISNENDGRYLNRGLVEFKEGFGARALMHDFYRIELSA